MRGPAALGTAPVNEGGTLGVLDVVVLLAVAVLQSLNVSAGLRLESLDIGTHLCHLLTDVTHHRF